MYMLPEDDTVMPKHVSVKGL